MIDAQRIPARSPDGEGHQIVYEGPAHLIPMVETLEGLPVLPEGEHWVLQHRKLDTP